MLGAGRMDTTVVLMLILASLAVVALFRLRLVGQREKAILPQDMPTKGLAPAQARPITTEALPRKGHHDASLAMGNLYEGIEAGTVDAVTLGRAIAKLSTLPLATLPAVVSPPLGSGLWLSDKPQFVGRQAELRLLAAWLKKDADETGQPLAVVTGREGIGKTQLAAAFVHRYGQFFQGGVFWLNFANPDAIPAAIADCSRQMPELPSDFMAHALLTQVRFVLNAWQSPLPRLLVFDDCDSPSLLAQWQPPMGGCRILLTSRRHWQAGLGLPVLRLDPLPRAESIELLRTLPHVLARPAVRNEDEPTLNAIAANLEDLPLALHLASCSLAQRHPTSTPTTYFSQLRSSHLGLPLSLPSSNIAASQQQPLIRALILSYQQLDPAIANDTLALALLARLACFAPGEPIPYHLVANTVCQGNGEPYAPILGEEALRRLTHLGLVESGRDVVLLHGLIADFVRTADTQRTKEAQQTVAVAVLAEARCINNARVPSMLLAWQVHLRHITNNVWGCSDPLAAGLCNTLGFHLATIGELSAARPYFERALIINEVLHGGQHPDTARSLNNLGALLGLMGEFTAARPYIERSLAIRETVLGKQHRDTARSLANLGLLLDSIDEMAVAQPYLVRALAILEEQLGSAHADTENVRNHLATRAG